MCLPAPSWRLNSPRILFANATWFGLGAVADYLDLMKQLFDFGALKKYLASGSCSLRIDCLSGGTAARGPGLLLAACRVLVVLEQLCRLAARLLLNNARPTLRLPQ